MHNWEFTRIVLENGDDIICDISRHGTFGMYDGKIRILNFPECTELGWHDSVVLIETYVWVFGLPITNFSYAPDWHQRFRAKIDGDPMMYNCSMDTYNLFRRGFKYGWKESLELACAI